MPSQFVPGVHPGQVLLGISQPSILQQSWQGPYPPPDAVERFERLSPGFLNRLVSMAERLEAAQIEQSGKALDYQAQATARGQNLGFATCIGALERRPIRLNRGGFPNRG
jgi:uncharacterized membrane protein